MSEPFKLGDQVRYTGSDKAVLQAVERSGHDVIYVDGPYYRVGFEDLTTALVPACDLEQLEDNDAKG